MFSSFSSFLPSAFQINSSQSKSNQSLHTNIGKAPDPQPPQTPGDKNVMGEQTRKRERKEKNANETFIVVRPPPSKSNHPLNLQVQLVPPQSRNDKDSSTHSLGGSAPDSPEQNQDSANLSRSGSTRSDSSVYSAYTSSTSVSSFASTNSSSRRMIIPLYNLQAHNVLTNTIVDAGTDAKVARFVKRGLEVIGLAILEPIEVWGSMPLPSTLVGVSSTRTSFDEGHRELGLLRPGQTGSRPVTPERATFTGSDHRLVQKPSLSVIPASPDRLPADATPQNGAKKIFTRMFKKKDVPRPVSIAGSSSSGIYPTSDTTNSRRSNDISRTQSHLDAVQVSDVSQPLPAVTSSRPMVLGIQPSIYPPNSPINGRPTSYVWVVRKWLKGTESGILNGVKGRLGSGRGQAGVRDSNSGVLAGAMQVEVRFEWSRGKSPRQKERKRGRKDDGVGKVSTSTRTASWISARRTSPNATGDNPSPVNSRTVTHSPSKASSVPHPTTSTSKRRGSFSHQSVSTDTGTATSDEHQGQPAGSADHDDSGEESDPEDSETPWTCHVSAQRVTGDYLDRTSTYSSTSSRDLPSDSERSIRLKVAMLSPTPHHPKVVGLLKVPFPLPDLEVDKLQVHRRVITPQGLTRPHPITPGQVLLTAEEIKDTVSSTALWLVVREAFGGVGRVGRKGDGWKIRG